MAFSSWLRSVGSLVSTDRPKQGRNAARGKKRSSLTRLGVEKLDERVVLSTFSVLNLADSGAGSLRAAIIAANDNPGSDVVTFAPGLRGTIGLTSGELGISDTLWIDGPGASRVAVSGNDASRVFNVGSGAVVTIDDLTVTRGHELLRGGGILNAGNLTLTRAVVSNNEVVGLPGVGPAVDAFGGGVLNTGTLTVKNTTFTGNKSTGGDGVPGGPGSTGLGGAIMSIGTATAPATTNVSSSTFVDNEAVGGAAGAGAAFTRNGIGGAIMNDAGTMTVTHSLFHDNRAVGGVGGGATSFGAGGAIANFALAGDATLVVSNSTLTGNQAIGGTAIGSNASQAGKGGAIANLIPPVAPIPVTVKAIATITHSTLLGNQAIGGAGTVGGNGQGGAITNETGGVLTVSSSLVTLNRAIGGGGTSGNGGNGLGGGIFDGPPTPFGTPSLSLNRTFIVLNRAAGGASSSASGGQGVGGGVYVASGNVANADLTAILANDASTSDDDIFGLLV